MVLHYGDDKPADIFCNISEAKESKILYSMRKHYSVERATAEEWYGQDNPNYGIHHWNVTKKIKN